MHDDQPLFGFDGTADDLTVVMLRRDGDTWRVESTQGPRNDDLSRVVARIAAEHPPAPPPRPADDAGEQPWADLVAEWMDRHQGHTFHLTDWQRAAVQASFEKLLRGGKIRL